MLSDSTIAIIVSGVVTIATMVTGFLTLWVKLKYGVEQAEKARSAAVTTATTLGAKLDENTTITEQTKSAAESVSIHSGACSDEMERLSRLSGAHETRIAALESRLEAVKVTLDSMSKNIDSTRHEMRGHLQTIVNKLDIQSMTVIKTNEKA